MRIMILEAAEIAEIRKSKGMNLRQFGQLLGVSEATASRWEAGIRHPRFATLVKLNQLANEIPKRKRRELSEAK